MVAPGDPVPGTSGTDAVSCGAMRLRACAKAAVGVAKPRTTASTTAKAAATSAATPMRKTFTSHPDIAAFLVLNHGNFKPRPARPADQPAQDFLLSG
jgi:hypothetical protein